MDTIMKQNSHYHTLNNNTKKIKPQEYFNVKINARFKPNLWLLGISSLKQNLTGVKGTFW